MNRTFSIVTYKKDISDPLSTAFQTPADPPRVIGQSQHSPTNDSSPETVNILLTSIHLGGTDKTELWAYVLNATLQ
jgi:hypothetical protein